MIVNPKNLSRDNHYLPVLLSGRFYEFRWESLDQGQQEGRARIAEA
jgi:hypothetical protein